MAVTLLAHIYLSAEKEVWWFTRSKSMGVKQAQMREGHFYSDPNVTC